MVTEGGHVRSAMALENVLIVMAKEALNARPVTGRGSVENVKVRVKFGALTAMVKEYVLNVKEKKK